MCWSSVKGRWGLQGEWSHRCAGGGRCLFVAGQRPWAQFTFQSWTLNISPADISLYPLLELQTIIKLRFLFCQFLLHLVFVPKCSDVWLYWISSGWRSCPKKIQYLMILKTIPDLDYSHFAKFTMNFTLYAVKTQNSIKDTTQSPKEEPCEVIHPISRAVGDITLLVC